jgi:hypothetical protein
MQWMETQVRRESESLRGSLGDNERRKRFANEIRSWPLNRAQGASAIQGERESRVQQRSHATYASTTCGNEMNKEG